MEQEPEYRWGGAVANGAAVMTEEVGEDMRVVKVPKEAVVVGTLELLLASKLQSHQTPATMISVQRSSKKAILNTSYPANTIYI